jgi:hypothetical protein
MLTRAVLLTASISTAAMSIAACDDGAAAPPSIPPAPAASMSLGWAERTGAHVAAARMSPLAAGRVYAAVSMAQHEAAKAATPVADQEAAYAARAAAITAASARVLAFLFPASADSLERYATTGTTTGSQLSQQEYARGLQIGRTAADAMIERLKIDNFTRAWTGTAPTGTNTWTPVTNPPSGVTLGNATPYFLSSGAQFRPAPPAFGSPAFNADLNEVLQFARNRTAEQTALAKQWDYAAGTTTAVGYWNKAATTYIAEKKLDDLAATRVLGLMHAAIFDAQIACWDAKYAYWIARPYQANTEISTVLAPPNHPTFPSGHSCVSASAARVLQEYFPERAAELNQLVTDAGMSRIYAGIHYRFDIVAGQQIGKSVAEWAISKF